MTKFIRKAQRWIAMKERVRNTTRELNALSDKELYDIGISRCDIYRVARGGSR